MKIVKILIGTLIAFSMSSCNDYLDINENPNNIHLENIDPALLLPGSISQIYRTQAIWLNRFGGLMMNSYAGNSYAFGSPFGTEYTLTVNNSFYPQIWDGLYRGLGNFALIENYDNSAHKYDNHVAIAKIMKAFYMQTIVDLYGNVPYSKAFQGQKDTSPEYDKDSDIYKALIADIEEAILLIDAKNTEALDSSVEDIVFKGDMANWKKFANTVKLRMLVRMSNVTGELATYRDQKLQTLSNESFMDTDVLQNPGYSAANDDQRNPFAANFYAVSAGLTQNYTLYTVSENFAISLNGNPTNDTRPMYDRFTGVVDGRRGRIFSLVGGVLKGVRQGATPGQEGAPTGNSTVSKIGAGVIMMGAGAVNPSGAAAKPGILMTKAEVHFLQAEAALRYPGIFSGDKANFENAIRASYTYLGATGVDAYLTAIQTKNGLGWTGSMEDKIEAIMTQKWIAVTGINPTESYIDFNRTGYPVSPLPTTTTRTNRPNRLIYPVSEYVANSVNVPKMSNDDAFTINQFTPFWVKR